MRFEKTTDRDLIRGVITHPKIYPELTDDFRPDPADWEPDQHPLLGYVAIYDGEEFLGLGICGKHSEICWEIHNAILPHIGWKRRARAAREFFSWLFSCGCLRIIGKVPSSNRYALKFNQFVGMKQFGANERSVMKGGSLLDEIWFGISASTYFCENLNLKGKT